VGVTFLQFVFFTTIGALIADTVRGIRQKGREAAH